METTEYVSLEQAIYEALVENTGRALCDSGDHYGRHWQKNQSKTLEDFKKEPQVSYKFRLWRPNQGEARLELNATISLFHFLNQCLESYDADLTKELWEFSNSEEHENKGWLQCVEAWLKHKGADEPCDGPSDWVNTYNGEDALSQTIQYQQFQIDSDSYVALQVHGGCDVRGGYTRPRIFSLGRYQDHYLHDNARFTVYAENTADTESPVLLGEPKDGDNSHRWDTYDAGYSFESGEWHDWHKGAPRIPPLQKYPVSDSPADRGKGFIYIDEEGNGYSPINGAKLEVYFQ